LDLCMLRSPSVSFWKHSFSFGFLPRFTQLVYSYGFTSSSLVVIILIKAPTPLHIALPSSSMRPSSFGLLATATIVSAIGTPCVNNDFEELVVRTSCGDSQYISKCIREYVNSFSLEEISPCFVTGGCAKDDAVWFIQECTMPDARQDLKKRATTDGSTTDAVSTAKPTAKTSATKAASSTVCNFPEHLTSFFGHIREL